MYKEEPPVVIEGEAHGDRRKTYQHPAFGMVRMSVVNGGSQTLFGSDIGHNQKIRISVTRAELDRHLSNDWYHERETLAQFEMSHAQFAQFITSSGSQGTPCTLTFVGGVGSVPSIAAIESKNEVLRGEIKATVRSSLSAIDKLVADLSEMVDSGKLSKVALKEKIRALKIHSENMPSNLAFTLECAEEALEKATSDAKIEVESFIALSAKRLGLESLQQLTGLSALPPVSQNINEVGGQSE